MTFHTKYNANIIMFRQFAKSFANKTTKVASYRHDLCLLGIYIYYLCYYINLNTIGKIYLHFTG